MRFEHGCKRKSKLQLNCLTGHNVRHLLGGFTIYIYLNMKLKSDTMEQVQVTQQEIQEACKKQVHRNKKKYYRKVKHKNN